MITAIENQVPLMYLYKRGISKNTIIQIIDGVSAFTLARYKPSISGIAASNPPMPALTSGVVAIILVFI